MATFAWTLPASVPAAGAKGKLTIRAAAGDQDVFAPAFSVNGSLVRCAGITNTPSYGTGCADGDQAAVGVSLQPNESKTVTQEFLIRGRPGTVTIVTGAPQNVVYAYRRTTGGQGTTVTEPAPGRSTTVTSPRNLPVDCTGSPGFRFVSSVAKENCGVKVTVRDSAGNFNGTTVVGAGGRTPAQAAGEAVAACWLIGPDALTITNRRLKELLASSLMKKRFANASPEAQLRACMYLVTVLFPLTPTAAVAQRTTQAAGGCRARRIAVAVRKRKGKVVSLRPAKSRPTATSIRYSCTASGGAQTITVDGRRKRGLRRALGKKLKLGVVRAKNAPRRAAKVTFTFGF